jgi:molybdate/tungstate transport system substrate-binding protein
MNAPRAGRALLCRGIALLILGAGAQADPIAGDLMIFHAGSLAVPIKEVAAAFRREYPSVRILCEAAGSRECARKLTDLGRACDVLASADYAVIDSMLIPDHADWSIKFAGNEMVIAYTDESAHAGQITRENWHEVLLREDVTYGRSDPNSDPCGYRTIFTAKLAARHYGVPDFAERIMEKDRRFIRPKETDLLALLETGAIDYLFIYRSVAEQHGLRWLSLPDEINLKRAEFAAHYRSVSAEISGNAPGEFVTQYGEPMVYGVTIPKNAPNPGAALAFVAFLLDRDKGLAILERNGQPGVVPSPSAFYGQIPEPLKGFARKP